ncbi:MAG: hypothetical protein IJL32_08150 [Oscillospiraceae bacterium]|nr:hypothetical protein [Oscillospiraceae bacterium]
MKKKVLTALFCIVSFALLLACKPIAIRAYAVNDFGMTVQEIETPFTLNNTSVYAGDYKVTISVSNNNGIAAAGIYCPFSNSAFSPICISDHTHPLVSLGTVLTGVPYLSAYSTNLDNFGLSFSTLSNITGNGDLFSFYLRPNPNASITPENITELISQIVVDEIYDEDEEPLSYTIPTEFEYTVAIPYSFYLGDIDGTVSNNGYRIGLLDVQKLLQMINSYDGTLYVTATDTNFSQTDYPGLYVMINNVPTLELRVADVNFDGIIDSTDHALLLDYYVDCIIGLEPEGEIGQLQTHVTYVVQYSTGS